MIRVRGLKKSFGDHWALRGVDLDVAEGECLALIGPNGAGKTTLLRVLSTLTKPSAGTVSLAVRTWRQEPPRSGGASVFCPINPFSTKT